MAVNTTEFAIILNMSDLYVILAHLNRIKIGECSLLFLQDNNTNDHRDRCCAEPYRLIILE